MEDGQNSTVKRQRQGFKKQIESVLKAKTNTF